MTTVIAGPYCAGQLADYGMEVVKVEQADGLGDTYVSVEHLVLAMFDSKNAGGDVLRQLNLDEPALLEAIRKKYGRPPLQAIQGERAQ